MNTLNILLAVTAFVAPLAVAQACKTKKATVQTLAATETRVVNVTSTGMK